MLVLARPGVLDARELVTVAEVTTSIRGLAAEVDIDPAEVGLDRPSVVNCDGRHTDARPPPLWRWSHQSGGPSSLVFELGWRARTAQPTRGAGL